ncbi:MAG: radical SAM protein [Deltaproteobacteria bacterium]|nr:radical SAM protein [Deltaproteobacteria bacterium]
MPQPSATAAADAVPLVPPVWGLLPEQLAHALTARGIPIRDDEARRVIAHRVAIDGARTIVRRPLSRALTSAIARASDPSDLEIVEKAVDPHDGFVKYLFRSPDGALSEAVRIPLEKPGCFSVCLSSQVGCAMGCVFCATGRLGLDRNLRAWEMVRAFCRVRDEAPGRITGAVFMGQGEPFHNYDEVIHAARILSHPCAGRISAQAITISTVGLVPQIRRYTAEGHRYRLIISLTSAVPARRAQLLPIAGRFTIEDVAAAIREHASRAKGRVTVAWVVMSGVNTGDDEVDALRSLLGDVPLRLNLIDVNDPREGGYRRASDEERKGFMNRLQVLGVPLVRRYSGGASRHAACGMLAAERIAPV